MQPIIFLFEVAVFFAYTIKFPFKLDACLFVFFYHRAKSVLVGSLVERVLRYEINENNDEIIC